MFCYIRHKKLDEDKRTVVFGKQVLSCEGTVRRYKDGVEIKPSEYKRADKKRVAASANKMEKKKAAMRASQIQNNDSMQVPIADEKEEGLLE